MRVRVDPYSGSDKSIHSKKNSGTGFLVPSGILTPFYVSSTPKLAKFGSSLTSHLPKDEEKNLQSFLLKDTSVMTGIRTNTQKTLIRRSRPCHPLRLMKLQQTNPQVRPLVITRLKKVFSPPNLAG